MKYFNTLLLLLFRLHYQTTNGFDCHEALMDKQLKYMEWQNIKQCLLELGGRELPRNTSENIWRLMKNAFDGLENIPPEAYQSLGHVLIAVPKHDLRNISMERVEIVEAFGAIRKSVIKLDQSMAVIGSTFNEEQMGIIAEKVRHEWLGKTPKTYSEFDLMSLGQIICYLNVSDIAEINEDAFKYAAEWIGNLLECPKNRLQAFAQLAVREDAFGKPSKWSKIDLSIIGNILNGLPQSEIESIDDNKLYLNRYYEKPNRTNVKRQTSNTPVPSATITNRIASDNE